MPKGDKLTPKQERFCQEYLIDLNATQAAIRAGYAKKSARLSGHRNITNDNIQEKIQKGLNKLKWKAEVSAERILREEVCLGYFDPIGILDKEGNQLPLHKIPEATRRAITGIEIIPQAVGPPKYKYKFSDKGKSLERQGRHVGMFKDTLYLEMTIEEMWLKIARERDESNS